MRREIDAFDERTFESANRYHNRLAPGLTRHDGGDISRAMLAELHIRWQEYPVANNAGPGIGLHTAEEKKLETAFLRRIAVERKGKIWNTTNHLLAKKIT